jgi:translation elongation factor Ts
MADITTQQIQELRARTGAGIKDCKAALVDSSGDFTKATEYLRQKGLASAVKKATREASEGIVHSYIHFGSRIGVLVEVNCETDFVARREELKELADSVAKQIAACPNVEYVSVADFEVLPDGNYILLTYPKTLKKGSDVVLYDGRNIISTIPIDDHAVELRKDFR